MKRRNLLHTGIAAVLLLSTGACEDFKFGNAFLDKPFTTDITIDTVYAHTVRYPTICPPAEDYAGVYWKA